MVYQVSLPAFEGPLDLLLQLVERQELDITQIALARVTGQYLEALQAMPELQPEGLAAFLAVASRLLVIKSRLLLPQPPTSDEEDLGQELVRQLIEYRRFKQVAQALGELDQSRRRAFARVAPLPVLPARADLGDVKLEDLTRLVQQVLAEMRPEPEPPQALARTLTIEELMERIERRLAADGRVPFAQLLAQCRSRLAVVAAFLAVLELLRRRRLAVTQAGLFDEIVLVAPPPESTPESPGEPPTGGAGEARQAD